MKRVASVVAGFKRLRAKTKSFACDGCGWCPPPELEALDRKSAFDLLHAHHVVPMNRGGIDAAGNLALLCPRCHALAHAMTPHYLRLSPAGITALQLLVQLQLLVAKPTEWLKGIIEDQRLLALGDQFSHHRISPRMR